MVKRKRDLTVCDPDKPQQKKANKVKKKKKPRLTWLEQRERDSICMTENTMQDSENKESSAINGA